MLISPRSPACILSFFVTSLILGDFNEAWAWSDDVEDKNEGQAPKPVVNGDSKADERSAAPEAQENEPKGAELAPSQEEVTEGADKKKRSKKKRS